MVEQRDRRTIYYGYRIVTGKTADGHPVDYATLPEIIDYRSLPFLSRMGCTLPLEPVDSMYIQNLGPEFRTQALELLRGLRREMPRGDVCFLEGELSSFYDAADK